MVLGRDLPMINLYFKEEAVFIHLLVILYVGEKGVEINAGTSWYIMFCYTIHKPSFCTPHFKNFLYWYGIFTVWVEQGLHSFSFPIHLFVVVLLEMFVTNYVPWMFSIIRFLHFLFDMIEKPSVYLLKVLLVLLFYKKIHFIFYKSWKYYPVNFLARGFMAILFLG